MAYTSCHELIDLLSKANTVEDIHTLCSVLCHQFGFDQFQYGTRIPTSSNVPNYIFISSYKDEWRTRYFAKAYMSIDPVVGHCISHITPFPWKQIAPLERNDKIVRDFMGEAREFGLNSGVSFPVHTPQGDFAIFSVASKLGPEYTRTRVREVTPSTHFFTSCLHENVRKVFQQQVAPLKTASLTERERECLLWVTEDKTTWDTSEILGVSEHIVISHLQDACKKLKVFDLKQAVARAIALDMIKPQHD
ncbi:MAG: helix-turn-helix transcriptional regulator [Sulfuricaulis sp.]